MLQQAIAEHSDATPQPQIARDELEGEINSFVGQLVHETVDPLISSVHERCRSTITEYKESSYQDFWDKVSGPLKMSEAITLIMDAKGIN